MPFFSGDRRFSFPRSASRRSVFAWIALLLPAVWLLGPALVSDRFFVFRDVGYFYLPPWHWMRGEWAAGRVPLWNPYDGFGVPLVADGTSAVFYPLWLLFFSLPFSLALCAKLYLTAHVLLAAIGAYRVVRRWQGSPEAGALAGIAYAFGGSVIFQVCNPPFLIGAAWLPWAMLCAERLLRRSDYRAALGLAVVLALMVLGGDPQMALHVALLTAGGLLWYRAPTTHTWKALLESQGRSVIASRPALLSFACGLAGCLAAVQIVPSMGRAKDSTRAEYNLPRSIYETPGFLAQSRRQLNPGLPGVAEGLLGVPDRDSESHHAKLYQYSQGPWRWIELIWPNISGRMFPTHRRWMDAIPAEGIVWTPSLYMGLIPFLLAVTQLRLSRGSPSSRWLSWTAVFFAAGSLGWYGVGWLMREMYAAVPGMNSDEVWLGQPVGGVYWFLVTFVPGYVYFRYPAKLWVVTALMLSLLAARGWDRLPARLPKFPWRYPFAFALGSFLGAGCIAYFGTNLWEPLSVSSDWFGPFDSEGATQDILVAFMQAAVVALTAAFLTFAPQKFWRWALLVTSVEICMANVWLLPTAPVGLWELPTSQMDEVPISTLGVAPQVEMFNDEFFDLLATSRPRTSSENRLAEILAIRRQRLYSHFRMLDPAGSLVRPGAESSLASAAEGKLGYYSIAVRPRMELRPDARVINTLPANLSWSERYDVLSPHFNEFFIPVLEVPVEMKLVSRKERRLSRQQITSLRETSQQLTIGVDCASPRFLIVRDSFDPDWSAEVQSDDAPARRLPILRADGVFRAVDLPAGKHVVTFTYHPRRVWIGGGLSALAWCGLAIFAALPRSLRQQRRQNAGKHDAVKRAGPADRDHTHRRALEPPQVE